MKTVEITFNDDTRSTEMHFLVKMIEILINQLELVAVIIVSDTPLSNDDTITIKGTIRE